MFKVHYCKAACQQRVTHAGCMARNRTEDCITMSLAVAITTYLCSTSCLATLYLIKIYLLGETAFPVYCSLYTITYCNTFASQLRHRYQQRCRVENLKISNLRTPRRGHDGAICNFAQFLYAYGNCTHRGKLHTDKKPTYTLHRSMYSDM
jgi:hypothetical protein